VQSVLCVCVCVCVGGGVAWRFMGTPLSLHNSGTCMYVTFTMECNGSVLLHV